MARAGLPGKLAGRSDALANNVSVSQFAVIAAGLKGARIWAGKAQVLLG